MYVISDFRSIPADLASRFCKIFLKGKASSCILYFPARYVSAPARAYIRRIFSILIVCYVRKIFNFYHTARKKNSAVRFVTFMSLSYMEKSQYIRQD